MDTQISLIVQGKAHRLGNGADAQLEGGLVGHLVGNIAADDAAHLVQLHLTGGGQRLVGDAQSRHLRNMDLGRVEGPGDLAAHLQVDALAVFQQRRNIGADDAGREVTLLVHRRGGEDNGVQLFAITEIPGHIPVIAAHHIGKAGVHRFSRPRAGKAGGGPEVGGDMGLVAVQGPQVQNGVDHHALDLMGIEVLADGVEKRVGHTKADVAAHDPAGPDLGGDALGGGQFLCIQLVDIAHASCSLAQAMPRCSASRFSGTSLAFLPVNISWIISSMVSTFSASVAPT